MADNHPTPLPAMSEKDIQRFWSKVDKRGPDECWPWLGRITPSGYGDMNVSSKPVRVGRISLFLASGVDPFPLLACHTCEDRYPPGDVGYRRCCNGNHLYAGTNRQNADDRIRTGRLARGDRHGSVTHPESVPRGERSGPTMHPERMAHGDRNGSRTHPEKRPRGATHVSKLRPDFYAFMRGDRNPQKRYGPTRGRTTITDKEHAEIKDLSKSRIMTNRKIAELYGLTPGRISQIKKEPTWNNKKPFVRSQTVTVAARPEVPSAAPSLTSVDQK